MAHKNSILDGEEQLLKAIVITSFENPKGTKGTDIQEIVRDKIIIFTNKQNSSTDQSEVDYQDRKGDFLGNFGGR